MPTPAPTVIEPTRLRPDRLRACSPLPTVAHGVGADVRQLLLGRLGSHPPLLEVLDLVLETSFHLAQGEPGPAQSHGLLARLALARRRAAPAHAAVTRTGRELRGWVGATATVKAVGLALHGVHDKGDPSIMCLLTSMFIRFGSRRLRLGARRRHTPRREGDDGTGRSTRHQGFLGIDAITDPAAERGHRRAVPGGCSSTPSPLEVGQVTRRHLHGRPHADPSAAARVAARRLVLLWLGEVVADVGVGVRVAQVRQENLLVHLHKGRRDGPDEFHDDANLLLVLRWGGNLQ